jgi:hypothetical protein
MLTRDLVQACNSNSIFYFTLLRLRQQSFSYNSVESNSMRACAQKFSVCHTLECKTGGLVISRHNEIRDELVDLASRAFTPSAVRDEPKIYPCRPAVELRTTDQQPVIRNLRKHQGEERGDVLIRGLWQKVTDAIIDVRITDLDAKTDIYRSPMKVLAQHERAKKRKYLEGCLDPQRRPLTVLAPVQNG